MALDGIASAMGYVVGKKAAAPAGAAVRFDVTGDPGRSLDIQVRDGRGVLVQDLAVEPTAVVKMDQETFWRLGCGRVPGETAVLTGLVRLEGDLSLAGRVVDSMAFMI
jgi:putative sterol carrier protein